jgi:acyl-coenzyme A thioesterase PaaI-like protein
VVRRGGAASGARFSNWEGALRARKNSVKATREELAHLLANAAFLKPFGFVLQSCAPGECTIVAPYAASLERPGGILSGITIMGAADVAMWLAIMTERGTAEQWVTTDLKTAFLNSARETDVSCSARVLKLGKRTAYGTAECRAANGELLAHHVLSYALTSGR